MTLAPMETGDDRTTGVVATLNYAVDDGTVPVNQTFANDTTARFISGSIAPHQVRIEDLRPIRATLSLERNGFVLVDQTSAVTDFYDEAQVRTIYYPEMVALIKRASGARRVEVFDHTVRNGDETIRTERQVREPVQRVHNDYTEWSGPQRVRDIMGAEAETLMGGRFAVIQVWRPINHPVMRDPLAFADGGSVPFDDFLISERRYPDRVGQTYVVKYNPVHRWYYVPNMRPDETVVFTVYDSARDGRVRFTAHTAFADPTSPPDAAPRESIEIRTLAFF